MKKSTGKPSLQIYRPPVFRGKSSANDRDEVGASSDNIGITAKTSAIVTTDSIAVTESVVTSTASGGVASGKDVSSAQGKSVPSSSTAADNIVESKCEIPTCDADQASRPGTGTCVDAVGPGGGVKVRGRGRGGVTSGYNRDNHMGRARPGSMINMPTTATSKIGEKSDALPSTEAMHTKTVKSPPESDVERVEKLAADRVEHEVEVDAVDKVGKENIAGVGSVDINDRVVVGSAITQAGCDWDSCMVKVEDGVELGLPTDVTHFNLSWFPQHLVPYVRAAILDVSSMDRMLVGEVAKLIINTAMNHSEYSREAVALCKYITMREDDGSFKLTVIACLQQLYGDRDKYRLSHGGDEHSTREHFMAYITLLRHMYIYMRDTSVSQMLWDHLYDCMLTVVKNPLESTYNESEIA